MLYGDYSNGNRTYVALFDNLVFFDKEGKMQFKEHMLDTVGLKEKFDANPELYQTLDEIIDICETDALAKGASYQFGLSMTDLVVIGFLYKFVGHDIMDKLGDRKYILIHSVAHAFRSLQQWQHTSMFFDGMAYSSSFQSFFSVDYQIKFDAYAELASFKEEIVQSLQANLDKLGYSSKTLGLYDCSNASISEADQNIEHRLKIEMADKTIFRMSDFQVSELCSYVNGIDCSHKLQRMANSLANEGFTSILDSDQMSEQVERIKNALPIVSYSLVMDNQGMLVDFDIIKAAQLDKSDVISSIKAMQTKHKFEEMAFFVDNEWSKTWDYLASFKLNGISYMVNDNFKWYTEDRINDLFASLKFSESPVSTLVNGAELDAFLYSSFEKIDYAMSPLEYSLDISEDDMQTMLQQGVAFVGSKSKDDMLLDQDNQSIVFKGNCFITHMPSLRVKELMQQRVFPSDWGFDKSDDVCGVKSFACDLKLTKKMGAKTGLMRNFVKINTTKNLFNKAIEALDLNDEATITDDGVCGHLLAVYCAMTLRQLVQFHPNQEGKALSNDQVNDLFDNRLMSQVSSNLKLRKVSGDLSNQQIDDMQLKRVLKSKITFNNYYMNYFNPSADSQRLFGACETLGFKPEFMQGKTLKVSDLAQFLDIPQETLERIVYEVAYCTQRKKLAEIISYDFRHLDV